MSLTNQIKEYALNIGYSKVGITTADSFPDYIEDLKARSDKYSFYIEGASKPLAGAAPSSVMPAAKSIIMLVYDYAQKSFPEELLDKVGRIYQARCYRASGTEINGARLELMKKFLEKLGCEIGNGFSVPERLAAARAGIVTYGRNNFAYADGIGSFILLCSFVIDKELDYDSPTITLGCPEGCSACLKACPTQAIYQPLKLDPRRCIGYNHWKTVDGGPGGTTSFIPYEIREKMGVKVHGCDICQEVCPRNRAKIAAALPNDEYLFKIAGDFTLENFLSMSDDFYYNRVQPLMYNYLKEKKYFQRNAAIALGNHGNPAAVPYLAKALADPEPLVREYAAWAVGKIGGRKGRKILEASLRLETSEAVKKEIARVLLEE